MQSSRQEDETVIVSQISGYVERKFAVKFVLIHPDEHLL